MSTSWNSRPPSAAQSAWSNPVIVATRNVPEIAASPNFFGILFGANDCTATHSQGISLKFGVAPDTSGPGRLQSAVTVSMLATGMGSTSNDGPELALYNSIGTSVTRSFATQGTLITWEFPKGFYLPELTSTEIKPRLFVGFPQGKTASHARPRVTVTAISRGMIVSPSRVPLNSGDWTR